MASHLISRAQCQSFVTSVAPYQTFRKQDPLKQIINNEIRRCYPERSRAACFVCGRLFRPGCLSVLDCDVHSRIECAEIKPQEGGLGSRHKHSGVNSSHEATAPPIPTKAPGVTTALKWCALLRCLSLDTSWGDSDAEAN